MLLFSRKNARMGKHDSMFRGDFVSTYSAIQWTLGRVCGCFGFRGWQGRKLRACFDLKTLATMLLISHFLDNFQFLLWPFQGCLACE